MPNGGTMEERIRKYRWAYRSGLGILAFLLLLGCNLNRSYEAFDYSFAHEITVTSVEEALAWCSENIEYVADSEVYGEGYWQLPEETYEKRSGDCEDFCLMFMYLCYEQLGYSPELLIVQYGDAVTYNHAIVELGAEWFEISGGFRISNRAEYVVYFEKSYHESMWMTARYHNGVI